ncbi:MAG: helix-turn-helix domain-containing protein [Blastocatellia bacterium]|nr:helix-turn-helix domain-containing protein [Blastocatellia bacterium]
MQLKQLRVACRLTLREAAKITDTDYTILYQIENGESRDLVEEERIKKILEEYLEKRGRCCRI